MMRVLYRKSAVFFSVLLFFLIPPLPADPSLEGDSEEYSLSESLEENDLAQDEASLADALAKYASFLSLIASPDPKVRAGGEKRLFDAFEKDPSSDVLFQLVSISVKGEQDPILRSLKLKRMKKVCESHPDDVRLACFLSARYMLEKDPTASRKILEDLFVCLQKKKAEPKQIIAVGGMLFHLYIKAEMVQEADDLFEKLRKMPELLPEQELLLVLAYSEFMISAEKKASDEKSFLFGWITESGKERCRRKFFELQKRFFSLYVSAVDPEHPLKICFQSAREKRELPGFLASLDEKKKNDPFLMRVLAFETMRKGSLKGSASLWEKILKNEPQAPDAPLIRGFLADIYIRTGKEREALKLYALLKKDFPQTEDISLLSAICFSELGKEAEAEKELRSMKKPTEEASHLLFLLCIRKKNYQEAGSIILNMQMRALAEKRVLKKPVALQGALALEKAGDHGAMCSLLMPYLKQNPKDVEILNFIGYTLANANKELPFAEKMLKRAVAIDPENTAIQDSMAWLCYRQGKFPEAETWIGKALTSSPAGKEDPVILDHAGDIYMKCGKSSAALKCWKAALGKESEEVDFALVREKIRKAEETALPKVLKKDF